jgi:hypothetical protein
MPSAQYSARIDVTSVPFCCRTLGRSEPRLVLHDVVLVIPEQSQIDGVIYWVNAFNSELEFWRNRWGHTDRLHCCASAMVSTTSWCPFD